MDGGAFGLVGVGVDGADVLVGCEGGEDVGFFSCEDVDGAGWEVAGGEDFAEKDGGVGVGVGGEGDSGVAAGNGGEDHGEEG